MKRILSILAIIVAGFSFSACENFLDTENLIKKDTSNFPQTQSDVDQMITGIYATMNNLVNDTECLPFFIFDMAGDDRLGGGSTSNTGAQAADRLLMKNASFYAPLWKYRYQGIYRANTLLSTIDNIQVWADPNAKNKYTAECLFLRAYFYLDLAQVFGEVPLVLEPLPVNLPKASADEIYAQIASDLQKAIELFPAVSWENTRGRASKWAAEALMARVWLFYTGYYNKAELPLVGGGSVKKTEVIDYLNDCIANSGHDLVSDQRNIWAYSNEYTSKTYPYGLANNLKWEGDGCKETIFALKFSNTAEDKSEIIRGYCNRLCEYYALRNYKSNLSKAYPFCEVGYSNGPASLNLWQEWAADPDYAGDYRREGSICDRAVELPEYDGAPDKEIENTNLLAKKYVSVAAKVDGSDEYKAYAFFYGGEDHNKLSNTMDLILIRFADVLLMHSELTETATGLNRVRTRANLPNLPYSLENIKKERRYELCFEAIRWNDLRRWGDVSEIVRTQNGQAITNRGHADTYKFHEAFPFMERYNATGGFFRIPETEIVQSQGVLTQNKGWESDSYLWQKHPYTTI